MVSSTAKLVIKTTVVLFVMMNAGINIGIFSPTFPDIEKMTASSTSQVSMTMIWAGLASVGGTLAIGPLFDRVNGFLLLTICMTMQGITIGLAPLWKSLTAYQAWCAVAVIFNFALMSGSLSVNCALWKLSPGYLIIIVQVTDLMHAVGTALTPQIVRPFIGHSEHDSSATPNESSAMDNITDAGGLLPVQKAYLIIGALDLATALICLSVYCWTNAYCRRCRHMTSVDGRFRDFVSDNEDLQLLTNDLGLGHGAVAAAAGPKLNPTTRYAVTLLTVMSLFFLINGGRDALLTGLLFTYVNKYVGWTVAAGTALVTVYHLTRVVVHAVLVPVSRWVSPTRLTVANLIVLNLGAVLAVMSLTTSDEAKRGLLTTAVIVTGIATSNVHPTAITVAEERIDVSAPIMAILVSSLGAGQIVFAPVTGWLLQHTGAMSFTLVLLTQAIVASTLFGIWTLLQRRVTSDENRSSICTRTSSFDNFPSMSNASNDSTRRRASKTSTNYDEDDIYERRPEATTSHLINEIDSDNLFE